MHRSGSIACVTRSSVSARIAVALLCVLALAGAIVPAGAEAWRGPVGFRGLTALDQLPRLRSDARTYQVSSYDRTGGNEDGVFGTYSCPRRVAEGCVIAERRGAGEIESIWFTRDFGGLAATGKIVVRIDGRTVVDGHLEDVVAGSLGPPFRLPFVANSGQSSGGGYIRVPMPFRHSVQVITENNPGYYHVIMRAFRSAGGVRRSGRRAWGPRRRTPASIVPGSRTRSRRTAPGRQEPRLQGARTRPHDDRARPRRRDGRRP